MRWISVGLLLLVACTLGCGAPLYPKVSMTVDPATGRVAYASQQETDLIIGSVEASVSSDGVKSLKVGTATQPAMVYGSASVGAMQVYVEQQAEYTKMLDVVGKNTTEQIRALGEWIPGIAGILTGMGASPTQIESAVGPAKALLANLKAQAAQLSTCKGGSCGQ